MYHIIDVTYDIYEIDIIKRYPSLFKIERVSTMYQSTYRVYTPHKILQVYLKEINKTDDRLYSILNRCLRQQKLNKILITYDT